MLFGRQDIPMKHVRVLLQRGFLPVSTDYRLCPELTLFDGPVTDCRESLRWARETLPFIRLSEPSVTVDTSRLLALGWSSGGHLAMTLGHTAKPEGIKPPDVILPFYSPTDLEDECEPLHNTFGYHITACILFLTVLKSGTSPITWMQQKKNLQRFGESSMPC